MSYRESIDSHYGKPDLTATILNHLQRQGIEAEDLDWEEQAKYPLREAAVEVKTHPEKPGSFLCMIHLRPHYQLDHMVSELELTTELSQST